MDKTFEQFVDICGLVMPITEEDLSENELKTKMQLDLLRDRMSRLKQSLASNLDYEQTQILTSVKSLWQVLT